MAFFSSLLMPATLRAWRRHSKTTRLQHDFDVLPPQKEGTGCQNLWNNRPDRSQLEIDHAIAASDEGGNYRTVELKGS
jgi:hypothetical protein